MRTGRLQSQTTALADAGWGGLTVSPGRLGPAFPSATTEYSASVSYSVTEITVTPSLNDSDVSFAVLDNSDSVLPDRDTVAAGHQVDLVVGQNVFKVRVTAEDNLAMKTCVVSVTRTEEDTSLSPSAGDPSSSFRFQRRLPGDVQRGVDERYHTGRGSQWRAPLGSGRRRSQLRRDLC